MANDVRSSLLQMAKGAIQERVDYEVAKVIDNILDVNTDPLAKRKVTLVVEMKPDEDRQVVNIMISTKRGLRPPLFLRLGSWDREQTVDFGTITVSKNQQGGQKMKTITTPETMKPSFHCTINGKKYSYPAGETVEVPDEVAAVIQNCINATTTSIDGEPALTKPKWGMWTELVKKELSVRGDGYDIMFRYADCEMTKEEYEAMISSEEFKGTIYRAHVIFDDFGNATTTYDEEPLNKEDLVWAYDEDTSTGYAYVKDFEDHSGYDEDRWKVTYGTEYVTETHIEQIPKEYLATE